MACRFQKTCKNKHEGKREGEAFKAKVDDKLDNAEEHANDNDDMSDENAENIKRKKRCKLTPPTT